MSLLFPCAAQRITGAALIRLYYKPVSGKKKVSFAKFGKFTISPFQRAQRSGRERAEGEHDLRPEIPQRTKQSCCKQKVKERARQRRGDHVEPQLTPAHAQGKEKHQQRKEQAVERIEHAREGAGRPAVHAQGAQKIVKKREDDPQQEGGKEPLRLQGEREAHRLSPRKGARGIRRGPRVRPRRRASRCARPRAARRRPG